MNRKVEPKNQKKKFMHLHNQNVDLTVTARALLSSDQLCEVTHNVRNKHFRRYRQQKLNCAAKISSTHYSV